MNHKITDSQKGYKKKVAKRLQVTRLQKETKGIFKKEKGVGDYETNQVAGKKLRAYGSCGNVGCDELPVICKCHHALLFPQCAELVG